MSKIFTSWTIDGEPAPWSSEIAYSGIQAVLAIETRIGDRYQVARMCIFRVLVGGQDIVCSCEVPGEPCESQKQRCEDFRTSVIKAWAAAL